MTKKQTIQLFEEKKVRTVWDDEQEKWFFCVMDVVEVLTESKDPKGYIKKMKQRDPELSKGWGQIVTPLSVQTAGGPQKMNCAARDGVFRITHGSTLKKSVVNEMWVCRMAEGEAAVQFNQREYTVRKGDIFVVMEGELFLMRSSSEGMEMELMVFHGSFLNVVYPFLGPDVNWGIFDSTLHIFSQMDAAYNELLTLDYKALRCMLLHQEKLADQKMMLSMTAHFLRTYYKAATESLPKTETTSEGKRFYQLLTQFYTLISEQSPVTERNLDYYAERLHITVRHLFKVCKSETGNTPKEIIDDFVVGDIKNTLLTTDLNFQQIAERFAFPDQSAFGQYFRRHTGLSLTEFRKTASSGTAMPTKE